ncbi:MAG: hypothetical protein ACI9KE_000221 [Polyangiales bacterium]|jgi:hypothetical protein
MRTLITGLLVLVGCGSQDAATPAAEANANPEVAAVPSQPSSPATAEAPTTTEGFISVMVDGRPMRFDYMPAEDNFAMRSGTTVRARASAGTEHGVRIHFLGTDLRQETLPATFETVMPSRENGMRVQMPSVEYIDESGARFVVVGSTIQCASFDEQVLRCSFGDLTLQNPDTDATVQLSEGQSETMLVSDAAIDSVERLLQGATGTAQ